MLAASGVFLSTASVHPSVLVVPRLQATVFILLFFLFFSTPLPVNSLGPFLVS